MLTRRDFITVSLSSAGGMLLGVCIPASSKPRPYEPFPAGSSEVSVWLAIDPDDTVTIRCAQAEMGEGVFTSMPMLIADELEVDWQKVRVEYASANRSVRENNCYGRMTTVGSMAVRGSRVAMQTAGAAARERLRTAAAQRWSVPVAQCSASDGRVLHVPSGRSARYGELAKDAAALTDVPVPAIRKAAQFKLAGKPMRRLDVAAKVNGSAVFGVDVRLPGMLYAAISHCPVFGGTVKSCDLEVVRDQPGVRTAVNIGSGVAVIAEHYWQAVTALQKLQIEWDRGAGAGSSSEQWLKDYTAALDAPATLVQQSGDADGDYAAAARKVEAVYHVPYLAHACMEPLNCTAQLQPGRLDIWVSSQSPDGLTQALAKVAGLEPANVYVHNCFLGGGFGRRSPADFATEAVKIARAVDVPVQMIWSREDDIRMGRYRPMSVLRFRAGLAADGRPSSYVSQSVTASIQTTAGRQFGPTDVDNTSVDGLVEIPYAIANRRVTNLRKDTHLPAWYWRAVGKTQNIFALESFIDELATAAGADPLRYRELLLPADKSDYLRVLGVLREKSGWGRKLPAGTAQGMAIGESVGSIVAQMAEVNLARDGKLRIERVVSVVDCGNLVNPLTAEEQVESSIVWALTATLYSKLTVVDGQIQQRNFDNYPVLRLRETPLMETHFSLAGGDKWGGMGEAAVGTVAPAVTNAIFRITGKRVRSLPLADHDLSWA
jgi:isoquinoline 1-oxidoreductase beta subunit